MLYRARDGLDARSRGRSCPVSQAQLTPSAIRAFPVLTIPAEGIVGGGGSAG